MFEIDVRHQPYEVTDLDAGTLLGLVAEDQTRDMVALRRKLRVAHQWCVMNPAGVDRPKAFWSDAGIPSLADLDEPIGGDGTPGIAAFAAEEYAAAAGLSRYASLSLLADVLDLVHRLPRLWNQVETLAVPGWKARRVAELSRRLSLEAARWFDAELAETGRSGWPTIELTLARATARFHPELVRDKKAPKAKQDWDVRLFHGQGPAGSASGTSELDVVGDSLDLERFHALVCEEAERLKQAGDTDTLGQRKAKALGIIAARSQGEDFDGRAASEASGRRDHHRLRVMVHVSLTDLLGLGLHEADVAIADAGALGPIIVEQLRDWLVRHGSIASVTPVLDMDRSGTVDRHDPPAWMASVVRLRDRYCVFPGCTRDSLGCDLDHIEPFDPLGPSGQTRPANLAPLCRRHHLIKTHGRWSYVRNKDGTYLWTNQHGRSWLVTGFGTVEV